MELFAICLLKLRLWIHLACMCRSTWKNFGEVPTLEVGDHHQLHDQIGLVWHSFSNEHYTLLVKRNFKNWTYASILWQLHQARLMAIYVCAVMVVLINSVLRFVSFSFLLFFNSIFHPCSYKEIFAFHFSLGCFRSVMRFWQQESWMLHLCCLNWMQTLFGMTTGIFQSLCRP